MTGKTMISVRLDGGLVNRLKNCIYWTPGATLETVISQALINHIDEMESKHGSLFEQRQKNKLVRRGT